MLFKFTYSPFHFGQGWFRLPFIRILETSVRFLARVFYFRFPLSYRSASWRPKGEESTDIKRLQHRIPDLNLKVAAVTD